jgi:hypothetical protein
MDLRRNGRIDSVSREEVVGNLRKEMALFVWEEQFSCRVVALPLGQKWEIN